MGPTSTRDTPSANAGPAREDSFSAQLAQAAAFGAAGQYTLCMSTAEQLLRKAQAASNPNDAALAAVLLLKANSNLGQTATALQWADVAMQAATDAAAKHVQAAVWVYRAWPLARQDQAVQAVQSMHRGLALMREHVPQDERPVLLTSIGLTYRALGLPVQALAPLRQALNHFNDGALIERRLRSRDNLMGTLLDAFDQSVTFDAVAAQGLLDEAQALLAPFKNDATTSGASVFMFDYLHAAAAISRRAGDAAGAQDLWRQWIALQGTLTDVQASTARVEDGVERALTAHALHQTGEAVALADEAARSLPAEPDLRLARELLWASQLAEITGDVGRALALYRRYHARVIANEHAAYAARIDELSATVDDQSLQLAVSNLQRKNAGLVSTFRQLSEQALTDTLTGVANRRGLQETYAAVEPIGQPLVLAMIDLDHFKKVNDDHSHGVGDLVLKETALLMRHVLREGDHLARYGGEEFTALLVQTPLLEACAVAERLRSRVQSHDWHLVAAGLHVTVSIGLAEVQAGRALQDAVDDADRQLYRAKQAGRNCVMAEGKPVSMTKTAR